MDKLIFIFLLVAFHSYGQEKDLDINKHLWGQNLYIVNSFLHAGQQDFFFVDRMYPGLVYAEHYDRCKDESIIKFILVKPDDSNKYEIIKYDACGQQTRVTSDSKALRFFKQNRSQIQVDSIDEAAEIDHTVFYSLYEFKDGKLRTYKYFCKECVDEEKSTRDRNQNLKMYKFLSLLDIELSELIK